MGAEYEALKIRLRLQADVGPLNKLAKDIKGKLNQIIRKTALDIQAKAQQMAAVDTGAMRNSVVAITDKEDEYSARAAVSKALNPHAKLFDHPEGTVDELHAMVAVGVEYGIYQEMGTVYTPAHPFMGPAAEAARPGFEQAVSKVIGP